MDRTQVCVLIIFTSSKQRRIKKIHVVVLHGKEIYQKAYHIC